jgi:hypothetical protein
MGEWRYSSTILDRGTRDRWVVNLAPQLIYPRVIVILGKTMCKPQTRFGCCGKEKKACHAGT